MHQERLLGYFSKALTRAAANYSITELELTGLYISVHAFRHLLKCTTFEVYTDHSAIPHIMKAKTEPATTRIKRLLERLSNYSMKVGYRKGTTMVVADFLSRNPQLSNDDLDIAFVVTRSQAKQQQASIAPTSTNQQRILISENRAWVGFQSNIE